MTDKNNEFAGALYLVRPVVRDVVFARSPGTVESREGPVPYETGDAIVSDSMGAWAVARARFEESYEPAHDQPAGAPGRYRKKAGTFAHARRLDAVLRLDRGDAPPHHGEPGDWLVWDADGASDHRIVAHEAFAESYALQNIPVFVAISDGLAHAERQRALDALREVQLLLPNTSVVCCRADRHGACFSPRASLRIARAHNEGAEAQVLLTRDALPELAGALRTALAVPHPLRYMASRASGFVARFFRASSEEPPSVRIAAAQLAALEKFNAILAECEESRHYQPRCDSEVPRDANMRAAAVAEPAGLARIWQIGAVADAAAGKYQAHWQEVVFAQTGRIARAQAANPLVRLSGLAGLFLRPSLASLALLAAFAFVAFSEFGGGCAPDDPWRFIGCATPWWKHYWEPIAFLAYVTLLVWAWWTYAKAKVGRYESRHQDLRLLAECLRSRYVRSVLRDVSCVTSDLEESADAEAGWIHAALRAIHDAQPLAVQAGAPSAQALARVQQDFLHAQELYHQDKLLGQRRAAMALLQAAARWALFLFVLAAAAMVVHQVGELAHRPVLEGFFVHVLTVAMVLCLALWGTMHKVAEVLGLEAEIRRGERVLHALQAASRGVPEKDRTLAALQLFTSDQAKWHRLHRDKPIEVPVA
jgi:hypothetical protein